MRNKQVLNRGFEKITEKSYIGSGNRALDKIAKDINRVYIEYENSKGSNDEILSLGLQKLMDTSTEYNYCAYPIKNKNNDLGCVYLNIKNEIDGAIKKYFIDDFALI